MSPHDSKTAPTNEPGRQHRLGVSLTQVVGSAVAAAAAAFGASFLGVAGTIIGAAVASVIATVASAMYTTSLTRTRAVVASTVTQWTRTSQAAPVVDPNAPQPPAPEPSRRTRATPWARVAVAAAATLVVALGGLTAVEAVVGKPLATLLGGSQAHGTSIGVVSGTGGSGTKTRSTPTRTPSPTAPTSTPSATPSATPDPTPSATPSGTPTGTPGATPSADPTSTPTPTGPLVTLP